MSTLEATPGLAVKAPLVANSDLMSDKPSLIGMTREEMADALTEIGVPQKQVKMRVSQLWNWLYVRGVSDFDNMTNVAKELRETLKAKFTIARPEIVEEQISNDGTRKWLMRFPRVVPVARWKSRPSIFLKKAAVRFASPARSAVRSPVPSATPAHSGWCAT